MKKRVIIPALAALLLLQLPFSACEKPEYVEGPGGGGDTSEQATVFSRSYTWSDSLKSLLFQGIGSQIWTADQSVIGVPITVALEPGDRVVTMLQLGLQKPDVTCTQNMHLDAGCILDDNGDRLPIEPDDIDSGVITREAWDGDELIRQFTRYQEFTVGQVFSSSVVEAFAKPWSSNCSGDTAWITNCSLTVIVIPRQ